MKILIEEVETYIRSGQFDEAEKRLRQLGKGDRKHAVAIASIARRLNQPNLAVKLLHPIVRPKDKLQDPPTSMEKIEYADALCQLGAVFEAWQLLNEVDADEFPQATIYKVYCLFSQWKYEEALLILEKYAHSEGLTPYVRCVGKINLAAALIQLGKLDDATKLLSNLRAETQTSEFLLLYGNSLELSAQVLILQEDFDAALRMLEESSEVLKRAGKVVSLFVEKWRAIAQSLKQKQTTQELRNVLLKAQSMKHWETVRDCDLYIAYLDQDRAHFEKLYFGTPYGSFRRRILHMAGPKFEVPATYLWSSSENPKWILHLTSGKVENNLGTPLATGQALHRFMIMISQDFYRPISVLSAFGKLFPNEFMNTTTSANRIHQIVKRCREWIADIGLPLKIEEIDGAYRLILGDDVGLMIPAVPLPLDSEEIEWSLLKDNIGTTPFDVHQANLVLSSSTSSTKRLLRWALEQGRIQKIGKGTSTSYQVISDLGADLGADLNINLLRRTKI